MRVVLLLVLALGAPANAEHHIVVIDPGHGGGGDSGSQSARTLSASNNATSPGGLHEKDLTLELSLEIRKQLEAQAPAHSDTRIDCVMTRSNDSNPDFAKRAAVCAVGKNSPAAIFSIHFNASEKHDALGSLTVIQHKEASTNYQRDQVFAIGLTRATHAAVAGFLPTSKARDPISDAQLHNGAGSNFFYQLGLHPTLRQVPKCFLEVEFMDRRDVEQKLLQHHKEAFPAIARAIAAYLYEYCGKLDQ